MRPRIASNLDAAAPGWPRPLQFAEFLDRVVADWMGALVDAQGPDADPTVATRKATLVIATIRGLLALPMSVPAALHTAPPEPKASTWISSV